MTLIVDAGALYAQANATDPDHDAVVRCLDAEPGVLVTSEAAAQEAAYLIGARLGADVELAFLDDLAMGVVQVQCLSLTERQDAARLARGHRDLRLGLADVTLMMLARRHRTDRILTLNQRDFRAVAGRDGRPFVVLPADDPAGRQL